MPAAVRSVALRLQTRRRLKTQRCRRFRGTHRPQLLQEASNHVNRSSKALDANLARQPLGGLAMLVKTLGEVVGKCITPLLRA